MIAVGDAEDADQRNSLAEPDRLLVGATVSVACRCG